MKDEWLSLVAIGSRAMKYTKENSHITEEQ